jgi:hypothetical protein
MLYVFWVMSTGLGEQATNSKGVNLCMCSMGFGQSGTGLDLFISGAFDCG